MQCQTCGLALDPQQVAQTGRCPRCGTPVQSSAYGAPAGGSNYGQTPQSGGYYEPTQQAYSPPQQGFGAPPPPPPPYGASAPTFGAPSSPYGVPPQPGFGGPPPYGAPGVGVAPPPRKSSTGLIVIIAVVLLVLIGGGVAAAFALGGKKSGTGNTNPTATSAATSAPQTATPGSTGGSLMTYTSSDGTFSVGYPADWQEHAASGGSGVEFAGPTGQVFEIINFGNSPLSPADTDNAFCQGVGTMTAGPSTVTVSGEQWTREECESSGTTPVHAVVEAVTHNGNVFLITYASVKANFANDESQYYTAMEQSFKFLS